MPQAILYVFFKETLFKIENPYVNRTKIKRSYKVQRAKT